MRRIRLFFLIPLVLIVLLLVGFIIYKMDPPRTEQIYCRCGGRCKEGNPVNMSHSDHSSVPPIPECAKRSLWARLQDQLLEYQILPYLLNAPVEYEDWFGYVNGILDQLHDRPLDDYRLRSVRMEAKRRGKTSTLRFRQSMMCVERGLDCAKLNPGFFYTGESDYYSAEEA